MAAVHTLLTMMEIFSDFLGLQLNHAKFTFVGFGLPVEEMGGCSQILATPRVQRFWSGPVFGTILGPNLNSVSVSVNLGHGSVRS